MPLARIGTPPKKPIAPSPIWKRPPKPGASFAELPAAGANPRNYAAWNKTFATWLFRMQKLDLMRSPSLR